MKVAEAEGLVPFRQGAGPFIEHPVEMPVMYQGDHLG